MELQFVFLQKCPKFEHQTVFEHCEIALKKKQLEPSCTYKEEEADPQSACFHFNQTENKSHKKRKHFLFFTVAI